MELHFEGFVNFWPFVVFKAHIFWVIFLWGVSVIKHSYIYHTLKLHQSMTVRVVKGVALPYLAILRRTCIHTNA